MRVSWIASLLTGVLMPVGAAAQDAVAPTIDCVLGYEGLRAQVHALQGAVVIQGLGGDVATLEDPDRWSVTIRFTAPGEPAHPAVTLRTLRKQVTGVWTSESKGCGYGSRDQFTALMADMKSEDIELTSVSRAEVERRRRELSPLATTP
jgi:hypothetical protein